MILQNLDLLSSNPAEFVRLLIVFVIGLAIAITVHEFSHAYVASRRGDDTARSLGRISLNPIVHLDRMGTLMLILAGFGWGKPVPVNSNHLRAPVQLSMAAVSVAGVLSNLLLALLFALPFRLSLISYDDSFLMKLMIFSLQINVILAIFNLLPFPPLDGFNILSSILPIGVMRSLKPVIRWGPTALLLIVVIDIIFPVNILSLIIGWPVNHIVGGLLG
jgi:Zn-dependent protease